MCLGKGNWAAGGGYGNVFECSCGIGPDGGAFDGAAGVDGRTFEGAAGVGGRALERAAGVDGDAFAKAENLDISSTQKECGIDSVIFVGGSASAGAEGVTGVMGV